MRICLVSHQYLPEHSAGAEIYTHRLAKSLQERGHEVLVFSTKKDLARAEGQMIEQEFEGVRNLRIIRNLFYRSFGETFEDPLPGRRFQRYVLEDWKPDVIHVHHLMHLSLQIPALAQAAGVPVLMTLHDYWLACPRFGQLLDHEGKICEEVDLDRCSACMTHFAWRNPSKLRHVARGLEILRKTSGIDLQKPLQDAWRSWQGRDKGKEPTPKDAQPDTKPDALLHAGLSRRQEVVRDTLIPAVDRFLCPSRFLKERMESFGFPSDKLHFHPLGVPSADGDRTTDAVPGGGAHDPLRVAYLGSVLPHKGVHLLLDAYEILQLHGVEVEMAIHGGSASNPTYGEDLRTRAEELGVRFTGAYLPERIGDLLAGTDLCIVPSLWFENRPITILDARVRRIPCLVSDLGGMKELVPDPRLRFAVGDAEDLARRLTDLTHQGVENLDIGGLPPSPEQDLQKTLQEYASICR